MANSDKKYKTFYHRILFLLIAVTLLFGAFFATPGVFKYINPDYLLAVREYAEPANKLKSDLSDVDKKIAQTDANIILFSKTLQEVADTSTALAGRMGTDGTSAAALAKEALKAGEEAAAIKRDLGEAHEKKESLQKQRFQLSSELEELIKKIDASQADNTNLYVVTRSLALGAIGALISIIANYLSSTRNGTLFADDGIIARVFASMAMGAIASVVMIGLFYTGFISIFPQDQTQSTTENPDFWKVTVLCLLAGAFSDRLFQAASGKVDQYLANEDLGASTPANPKDNAPANRSGDASN